MNEKTILNNGSNTLGKSITEKSRNHALEIALEVIKTHASAGRTPSEINHLITTNLKEWTEVIYKEMQESEQKDKKLPTMKL